MIGLTVFAALLAAIALGLLLAPLTRDATAAATPDERAGNLRVLREQLAQIDADLASGAIDAEQHRRARAELERRVLEEEGPDTDAPLAAAAPALARRTAWALVFALPLFAVSVYLWIGTPAAVRAPGATAAAPQGPGEAEIDAMVQRLAERMQANPGDGDGWAMLARSYAALDRFEQAVQAYAKAVALLPADATLLADYADALAMTQGQVLAGEPTRLIEQALRVDPRNLKALALAASAAMERKDYRVAVAYWQAVLPLVAPGSEQAQAIERSLAAAQAGARADATPAGGAAAGRAPAAASAAAASGPDAAARLRGTVRLAPALASRVSPGDTLFVFARAVDGPRAPLAILRRSAGELPLAFTLDDSQAMSPQMRLSQFETVQLVARVSRSGQAAPQSGDLQGQTQPVRVGSSGIEIVIDSVVP